MKRIVLFSAIPLLAMLRISMLSAVPSNAFSQAEADIHPNFAAVEKKQHDPDKEGLKQLLDETLLLQPCSAGNSLRMAALGGGLYRWLYENPEQFEAAKQTALAWGGKRSDEERRRAALTIRMLGNAAQQMRDEELLALLSDAGITLNQEEADKEGFLHFAEAVSRSLLPEIFKNSENTMNIFR